MKIAWKISYLVTWSTSNCNNSIILKNDMKLDKLDAWRTRNNVAWDTRNDVSWRARYVFAWKARNLNLAILAVFSVQDKKQCCLGCKKRCFLESKKHICLESMKYQSSSRDSF